MRRSGMNSLTILLNGLLAGCFSSALGVILTAPPQYLVPVFFCGFAGRFVRDGLVSVGLSLNWSTMIAAAAVVLVAAAFIRRHAVSPVALVSGVLPLAASASMFDAMLAMMRVSSSTGEPLRDASVSLISNTGKLFMTSLAIALGLAAGVVIVRVIRGERAWGSV
jgi:uncharacterized membrane protein YjjB (DUF3815 family)